MVDPDNPANISSYAVHTCVSSTGLRLVATYFPGVHPTGEGGAWGRLMSYGACIAGE